MTAIITPLPIPNLQLQVSPRKSATKRHTQSPLREASLGCGGASRVTHYDIQAQHARNRRSTSSTCSKLRPLYIIKVLETFRSNISLPHWPLYQTYHLSPLPPDFTPPSPRSTTLPYVVFSYSSSLKYTLFRAAYLASARSASTMAATYSFPLTLTLRVRAVHPSPC